jgi:hypothetical protein
VGDLRRPVRLFGFDPVEWAAAGVFVCVVAAAVAGFAELQHQATVVDDSLSRVPSVLVHPRDTAYVGAVAVTGYRVWPTGLSDSARW